ncbi:MAG: DUF2161 family putative PD-(D/E)XK-type phosphodiesterase [Clostridiales bacterium]|nr:DUF2161 family putative PD-(D/E)XK-type phosphodiesterase [Clostridiales bacterium]
MEFKEADLYPPVQEYFLSLDYDVQAEVKSCDLVAKKDNETVIAELKRNFCLKLVYQAIDRQAMTDLVYVVIPRPKKGAKGAEWRHMLMLMKRLNIGIITVALDSPLKTVDVVSVPEGHSRPKNTTKQASLNKETDARNLRTNTGGVTKTKIMTAYREKSIYVLCIAERLGEVKPAEINKILDEPYAGTIVSRNFYGWFKKISKGIYGISDKGLEVLNGGEYPEAIEFYRNKAKEISRK